MELTMLGTGNAAVTECYNTCFALREKDEYFLVDAGGGNGILSRLKAAGIDRKSIHTIFVTHKHIDHILGVIWLIRMICQDMNKGLYGGELVVYGHDEVIDLLLQMSDNLLQKKQSDLLGKRVHPIKVSDGEQREILGKPTAFFDIKSKKAKQFGFCMEYESGKKLTCCGDEPYNPCEEKYARKSEWLLHEAFCLFSEDDIFSPYEKHHSTVKDACTLAKELEVKNLLLYHTEDKNIKNRKALYTAEGRQHFDGNIYVPNDLEKFVL